MENSTEILNIIKLVWPLVIFQLAIQIYAIIDVAKKNKTKNLSVPIWILIILLGEIVGPVLYFLIGRAEED